MNGPTSRAITVSDTGSTGSTYSVDSSTGISVTPCANYALQLIVPGELAAPGVAAGKNGAPTNRIAGTAFNVTVSRLTLTGISTQPARPV